MLLSSCFPPPLTFLPALPVNNKYTFCLPYLRVVPMGQDSRWDDFEKIYIIGVYL